MAKPRPPTKQDFKNVVKVVTKSEKDGTIKIGRGYNVYTIRFNGRKLTKKF